MAGVNEIVKFLIEDGTSIGALALSIIALVSQKRMAKQNVMPYLSIDLVDLPNRIAVNIVNDGIGVAIINKVQILYKEEESTTTQLVDEVERRCEIGSSLSAKSVWKRYDDVREIGPAQKKVILELEGKDQKTCGELRNILKSIEIRIQYESIYAQKFTINKKLEYFGRDTR